MTKRLVTVGAMGLLAAALASSAAAQGWIDRGPVMVNPNFIEMFTPAVDCHAYGGLHIVLQNEGVVPISAGTTILWAIAGGASGTHVLATQLDAGGAVLIENALSWPVRLGVACTASIV